ncbi:MAG: AAA family ATPase [Phycisphaerales bacterium]
MTTPSNIPNPFRPGAGHMPPHLAGRGAQVDDFGRLLDQEVILRNLVLTGLRGVGKTVLLDTFKPLALGRGWVWVGTDMSESVSVSEETLAVRLITDLSVATSSWVLGQREVKAFGFDPSRKVEKQHLDYETLIDVYESTPGLIADKLKRVLEVVSAVARREKKRGIVFAYDEAQNLSDHARKDQFPLSMLMDLFHSIQRQNVPFMLVLAGIPTLFPKLVEARAFAERMFHVMFLQRLDDASSREAITKPIDATGSEVKFNAKAVESVVRASGGYPYFIQFICREIFDIWIQQLVAGEKPQTLKMSVIVRKLDQDFFAGRWSQTTDRQRELMTVVASLDSADDEFTVQEIVAASKARLEKPFSPSHVSQILGALAKAGLIYKNRHGKYSFAVPMLGHFIQRQTDNQR